MIEFLLLCVAVICVGYYYFVAAPKKKHAYYVQILNNHGYKVLSIPFKPFSIPLF